MPGSRDKREQGRENQLARDLGRVLAATGETSGGGMQPLGLVVTQIPRPARNLRQSWPRRRLDATHIVCGGARNRYEASSDHCWLRSWEGEKPARVAVPVSDPDDHSVLRSALPIPGWMEENGSASIPTPPARWTKWTIPTRCVAVGRRRTTSDGSEDGKPARSFSDALQCACMASYAPECG